MRASARADAEGLRLLHQSEATVARQGDAMVRQGEQHLALCSRMVELLQQLVQRGQQQ